MLKYHITKLSMPGLGKHAKEEQLRAKYLTRKFWLSCIIGLMACSSAVQSEQSPTTKPATRQSGAATRPAASTQAAEAKDVVLQRQFSGNVPVADGGFTLAHGERISFDARGSVRGGAAGFWKGLPDKLYTAGFFEKDSMVAIVEFQGSIRWNGHGEFAVSSPDFMANRVLTDKTEKKFIAVKSFKIDNDKIIVVAENGEELRLHDFGPNFVGKVDRVVDDTKAK